MNFSGFIQAIPDEIKAAIGEVNEGIKKAIFSDSSRLTELSSYVVTNRGKQLRPLFLFTCAMLFGAKRITADMIQMATVVELLHTATLIHDDIIDNAKLRRGKPSLNRKAGINAALLVGDFLLIRAFGICSRLPDFICAATEELCVDLVVGELEEGQVTSQTTLEDSLKIAELKTASLFKLCSLSAAYFSGKDAKFIRQAEEFGKLCGISFQVLDDLMDVLAEEKDSGKVRGIDLKEKKPSVPIVLWLQDNSAIGRDFLENHAPDNVDLYLQDLRKSSAIQKGFDLLSNLIKKAKTKLLLLNNEPSVFELLNKFLDQFNAQAQFFQNHEIKA